MRKALLLIAAFAVMGFKPQTDTVTVTASFYQSGEVTANGEKFNPQGLTAAHRTLRFGTILRVRNIETERTVIVRVNDRGPYVDGRSLDLSRGAAEALDMIDDGLAQVEVTVLN